MKLKSVLPLSVNPSTFKVSRYSGKDEVMSEEKKITLDEF